MIELTSEELATRALEQTFGARGAQMGEDGIVEGVNLRKGSKMVQYWVRRDGWICTGPSQMTNPIEAMRWMTDRRMTALPLTWGHEVAGNGQMSAHTKGSKGLEWLEPLRKAGGFTAVDEDGKFNHQRGEFILPKDQAVAIGLHRIPEVVAIRYDLADVVDLPCPNGCTAEGGKTKIFTSQESVNMHVQAAHKESVANKALGDTIAKAMSNFGGGGGGLNLSQADLVSLVASAVAMALNITPEQVIKPTEDSSPPKRGRGRPPKVQE